jgi:hypothetical protein
MAEINFSISLGNDDAIPGTISATATDADLRAEVISYFDLNHASDVSVEADSLMLINATRGVVIGNGRIDEWIDEGDCVQAIPEQFAGCKAGGRGSG